MKSFAGSFRNLNFSRSPCILFNLFFPFTDIKCFFFSSFKLQYCRTIVFLNFSKKPLFQKRRWSCDFPPRPTPKFLGSIGYQICLAMELRWGGLCPRAPLLRLGAYMKFKRSYNRFTYCIQKDSIVFIVQR